MFGRGMAALLLFLVSGAVYLMTAAPSITWCHDGADGAELAAAVASGGIAHPPGYPTYLLLGRLFALLPFGDIAYRLNLMSAFFAAATIALTYLLLDRLLDYAPRGSSFLRGLAAAGAALALAFSPVFWSQATIAEVHSLNAFFVILTSLLVATGRPSWSAFALGLGLGNHLTLAFWASGLAYIAAARGWGLRAGALPLFLGLAVYLYLPLVALGDPPLNWGNPSSPLGFVWLVTGGPYREFVFGLPPQYLMSRIVALSALLAQQLTPLGFLLGILGLAYLGQIRRRWAAGTLLSSALTAAYALGYNTTDSYLYLLPCFFALSLWLGWGLLMVLEALALRLRGRLLWSAAVLLTLALPAFSLVSNYATMDLRGDREAQEYAAGAFEVVEENALILADTDPHIFSLWYQRFALRPDSGVVIVARPLLGYAWYRDQLGRHHPDLALPPPDDPRDAALAVLEANLSSRPLYVTDPDPLLERVFPLGQADPLYRVIAPGG